MPSQINPSSDPFKALRQIRPDRPFDDVAMPAVVDFVKVSALEPGRLYFHKERGPVRIVNVEAGGVACTIGLIRHSGYFGNSDAELRQMRVSGDLDQTFVAYPTNDVNVQTPEIRRLIRQGVMKRITYPEVVPLLFCLHVLADRALNAPQSPSGRIIHEELPALPGMAANAASYTVGFAQQSRLGPHVFETSLRRVLIRIFRESGEDLVIAAALRGFGRERVSKGRESGVPILFSNHLFSIRGHDSNSWRTFVNNSPPWVLDYIRGQLLFGMHQLHSFGGPLITPREYHNIRRKFEIGLKPYYPIGHQKREMDPFSHLINRCKRNPDLFPAVFQAVRPQIEVLKTMVGNSVDLVIPAPALQPTTNRSVALTDFVARELQLPALVDAATMTGPRPRTSSELPDIWRRAIGSGGLFVADPKLVQGKRLLVVDDNRTTGSTRTAIADGLYSAGAERVTFVYYGVTESKSAGRPSAIIPAEMRRAKHAPASAPLPRYGHKEQCEFVFGHSQTLAVGVAAARELVADNAHVPEIAHYLASRVKDLNDDGTELLVAVLQRDDAGPLLLDIATEIRKGPLANLKQLGKILGAWTQAAEVSRPRPCLPKDWDSWISPRLQTKPGSAEQYQLRAIGIKLIAFVDGDRKRFSGDLAALFVNLNLKDDKQISTALAALQSVITDITVNPEADFQSVLAFVPGMSKATGVRLTGTKFDGYMACARMANALLDRVAAPDARERLKGAMLTAFARVPRFLLQADSAGELKELGEIMDRVEGLSKSEN